MKRSQFQRALGPVALGAVLVLLVAASGADGSRGVQPAASGTPAAIGTSVVTPRPGRVGHPDVRGDAQNFIGSDAYWDQGALMHSDSETATLYRLHGAIWRVYIGDTVNGVRCPRVVGDLGYPTSDEFWNGSHVQQNFQVGEIHWYGSNGSACFVHKAPYCHGGWRGPGLRSRRSLGGGPGGGTVSPSRLASLRGTTAGRVGQRARAGERSRGSARTSDGVVSTAGCYPRRDGEHAASPRPIGRPAGR